MNLSRLNEVLEVRTQLNELIKVRQTLYNTVTSPDIFGGYKSSEPNDPVSKAVNRIMKLDEEIEELNRQYTDMAVEVLSWLYAPETTAGMRNPSEFRSIVICRYLRAMSWNDTTLKIMRSSCEATAWKKVYRYFKNHPEG